MVSQEMAYDLLYCKLNHIHPDLSHSHGVECFYQLLSLFTLKLIIDGSITNDFKSPKQISGIGFRSHFMCLIWSLVVYMNIL